MQLSVGNGGGSEANGPEREHEHNHDGSGEGTKREKDPKTREYEAKDRDVEKYSEKDNACSLRATGDKEFSELNERASHKGNELDSLLSDIEKENSIQDRKKELDFNVDKTNPNYEEKFNLGTRAAVSACEQMEKMQGYVPDGYMKDFANGSCKMVENFADMKNWNHKEPGWDKFFHCMGNCEAAEYGKGGSDAAKFWGEVRETVYRDSDSQNDIMANERGRLAGENGIRCYDACVGYKPRGY
jgi:hypothetical protein